MHWAGWRPDGMAGPAKIIDCPHGCWCGGRRADDGEHPSRLSRQTDSLASSNAAVWPQTVLDYAVLGAGFHAVMLCLVMDSVQFWFAQ